jgi:excinuclease ABC subunit C
LDAIPGIGKVLKRELLRHFGSVAAFRAADTVALQQVQGIGPELAQRILSHLGSGER